MKKQQVVAQEASAGSPEASGVAAEPWTSHLTSVSVSFRGINNSSPQGSGTDKMLVWFRSSEVNFSKKHLENCRTQSPHKGSVLCRSNKRCFLPTHIPCHYPLAPATWPTASYSLFLLFSAQSFPVTQDRSSCPSSFLPSFHLGRAETHTGGS